MNHDVRLARKLSQSSYFKDPKIHERLYFLTPGGQARYNQAQTPEAKADLYFTFLSVLRAKPEQKPLNQLLAFLWANFIAGDPSYPYGRWPDCFDITKNPLLAVSLKSNPSLSAFLSAISPKKCTAGLEEADRLFAYLEKPNADGSFSSLYRLQRGFVYGWIQLAEKGDIA